MKLKTETVLLGTVLTQNTNDMRNYRRQEPRLIKAKFSSQCKETHNKISKGDDILYYPNDRAVFCAESKQYKDFLLNKEDEEYFSQSYFRQY